MDRVPAHGRVGVRLVSTPTPDEILRAAGVGTLGMDPSPHAVESVLGKLVELADGAHPAIVRALRDGAVGYGVDREAIEAALGVEPTPSEWPAAPDVPGPPKPTDIPLSGFPEVAESAIRSISESLQVHSDLSALSALASASAAIADRGVVEVPRGGLAAWRESR